ncbi:MAG: tRNA pseudouridine(38-40) synthase TruA [Lachnospiraceae bacterium]|nr:tRNA pseudouridine(38-40) synthase TruA [Lachnospiraceae bacterium]
MMRVKIKVAYDGTAYHGWQIQNNGDTIEAQLNRHLSELLGEKIQVIGASRTDSGVHALCNVAVFDTNTRMPAGKISYAMNQRLPEDIRIQESVQVADDFHPRKCKSIKTYEYKIWRGEFPMPTQRLYSHFMYTPVNVELMREAAAYLEGKHDFKSFCSADSQAESTVRTIYKIELIEEGNMLKIRISGSGFLYNMVRIIVGTLIEFGTEKYPTEKMPEILEARDRQQAGPTMPAKGLTLVQYDFL